MAFATATQTITLTERFSQLRANIAAAIARRKKYNTTVRELNSLSNRDLADLGISRSGIKAVALETL